MESLCKFITTLELGRLTRWLRLLGFDCLFFDAGEKSNLIMKSLREKRIILSRDSKLSRRSGVGMIHVESDFVEEQLTQVIKSLRLKIDKNNMFTRCVECNTILKPIEKNKIRAEVPQHVYKVQEEFMKCGKCHKIYWKGTHWGLANKFLNKVKI